MFQVSVSWVEIPFIGRHSHIECQQSSETLIYEGKKVVELDLRRAQASQKFANSSRIHEDVDATSCLFSFEGSVSVADPQSYFPVSVAGLTRAAMSPLITLIGRSSLF
jgi:hypothetical protein